MTRGNFGVEGQRRLISHGYKVISFPETFTEMIGDASRRHGSHLRKRAVAFNSERVQTAGQLLVAPMS